MRSVPSILVVDDVEDAASPLVLMLRRAGYDAIWRNCAAQLFEQLRAGPVSLVFLDIAMPDKGGIECLREMAAHPAWCGIPVIVYSADYTMAQWNEAMAAGAKDYVVKGTTSFNQILELVKEYVPKEGEGRPVSG
jgi:CheY-like chemotaxis protein